MGSQECQDNQNGAPVTSQALILDPSGAPMDPQGCQEDQSRAPGTSQTLTWGTTERSFRIIL